MTQAVKSTTFGLGLTDGWGQGFNLLFRNISKTVNGDFLRDILKYDIDARILIS